MFEFIRSHQRLMQLFLLLFVAPSFAFLGISGYSYVVSDTDIAEVGHASITKDEFTRAQRNQLQQMQESSQGRFDPAMLDNPESRQALLDQIVDREIEVAVATREHFGVSDATLRRSIAAMAQFQENGQFSADRYHQVLTQYGMTPHDFEQSQRAELALNQVLGPIGYSASLPTPVLDGIKRALTEERRVRLRTFPAADHLAGIDVSKQDIQQWYDGHQDALRLPDQVSASYIVLDEAAAMASVSNIPESQLKDYYEQNKSRYVVPARVNVSHILIKVPSSASEEAKKAALAKAQAVADKARAEPGQFASLARKESQDAGTAREGGALGWVQRGTLPLPMEQAVFALKPGQVSDPIKGPDGYHVFLANEVQPEKGESFEEARGKVEDEVHRQLAADRFADMATKLTSLVYDNPSSLEPAAKQLGLAVRHATGIARDRLLTAEEAGPGSAEASDDSAILDDVRVRQALFSRQVLGDKQNSGVIEISPDTMVVVRVDKETPAHVPPLVEVSDHVKRLLIDQRARDAAIAEGKQVLETLQKQEAPSGKKVMAQGFESAVTISRLDSAGVAKAVLDAAFSLDTKSLPAYGGVSLPKSYVIVELEHVTPGSTDKPALAGLSTQLAQIWGASEQQAVLADLRAELGVKLTKDGKKLIEEGDSGT